jgi:hypothetical protein
MLCSCYLVMVVFSGSTVLAVGKCATVSLLGPVKTINRNISKSWPSEYNRKRQIYLWLAQWIRQTKRNIPVVGLANITYNEKYICGWPNKCDRQRNIFMVGPVNATDKEIYSIWPSKYDKQKYIYGLPSKYSTQTDMSRIVKRLMEMNQDLQVM